MPFMRFTIRVAATTMAPVEPAPTYASPSPAARSSRPFTRLLSLYSLRAEVGSAQTGITRGASTKVKPLVEIFSSSQIFFISASLPTAIISVPSSLTAISAPLRGARGALSPPYISIIIFIKSPPMRQPPFRRLPDSVRPCDGSFFQEEEADPYLLPWAENLPRSHQLYNLSARQAW